MSSFLELVSSLHELVSSLLELVYSLLELMSICSETKEYAKIFCEIFARVSVKNVNISQNIFLKNI